MTVTPHDLGWLTGIIDGEGCFTVKGERDKKIYPYLHSSRMPADVLGEMNRLREGLSSFKEDDAIPGKLNPEDRVRMEGYLAKPLVAPT